LVIEKMKHECLAYCSEEPGAVQILEHIMKYDPIQWLDETAFNAAALNRIFTRFFNHLPYYNDGRSEQLEDGLNVPGEITDSTLVLSSPVNLVVCAANIGALGIAEEVLSILSSTEINILSISDESDLFAMMGKDHSQNGEIEDDDCGPSDDEQSVVYDLKGTASPVILLYLNEDTFLDDDGSVSSIILAAKKMDIDIILVHEQEVENGGCNFNQFFRQVPQELIDPPYQLLKEIAIPVYSTPEYRSVSMNKIILRLGGVSISEKKSFFGVSKCVKV
jgi:hypothetical protein